MSQDQQFLNPQQQDQLFQKMKEAGLLSQDMGQNTSAPDEQAQGAGYIDPTTLHSIIKHAISPNSVPMQEGDKIHPMDAMQQIAGQMQGPSAPNGVNLASGPKLQQGPNGLTASVPSSQPLLKLLGMKKNVPINAPNFYTAAKNAGVDKFLPSGLAQMPDGTPFVGPEAFTHALNAQKTTYGQGNQTYTTKDQLMSQGLDENTANKLMAANPNGVTNKEISNYMGNERIKSSTVMADARATMAQMAVLAKKLQVGGFDAAQPLVESSFKNVGLATRAQQAIDQITANGGMAIQSQRAELAAALGSLTGQNAGVLTDQRMNEFMPTSAKSKFGNWLSYWTNENQPIDFTGFLPQLQDLLTREKQANQGMITAGQQLGINIMGKGAKGLQENLSTSPLMQGAPTQAPQPKSNGAWRVIR